MRAITVSPGREAPLEVCELADPEPGSGEMLVQGLALGVCGTDREVLAGGHGALPEGQERLVLGHESLGRVRWAPEGSGFTAGDLAVGVVRRPDPVPCGACARGEFDMCRNGRFTERGIKGADGYGAQEWVVEPEYAVRLDPRLERVGVLAEPASVVAKAWEQIERIGGRSWFDPQRVLVTGAGPIGLLAALLGKRRGLDVHVLDRHTDGPKPAVVGDLGAEYHTGDIERVMSDLVPDIVVEATGAARPVFEALAGTSPYGVVCLTGVSPSGRRITVDAGSLNRDIVLENDAVVGSVNANLRHYRQAAEYLAAADAAWLERIITRRVPVERAVDAFDRNADDIKPIVALDPSAE
ncbi:glucose 1-dehydrogenase [Streptomonospora salina]|uniref:Threonine dehydrogenase-like Zn-dependent dehydrogenase n=1 Tax=Streptomonospora salina TaxID=104205 RepID=A0A841E5P3_9ACTN|nr:glucose 1-dehydrogenase [Streptomonospora salina]MBB5998336.1 threonine dehydrogenase-like Zn-dependent dehydrogenase [Streptomonospora salina]